MMPIVYAISQLRRATSNEWSLKNPIIRDGEPVYERDTKRVKVGDGVTPYNQLDYHPAHDELIEIVDAAVEAAIADGNPDGGSALQAHIDSATPHPAYDDGPSLVLLYSNAKV